MSEILDRKWHLAETDDEVKITEFELSLWRVFYGFLRWQEDCENCANNSDINGHDLAILHVIRMRDRAKSIYDIGRLLNREDNFNIQYSIRKLEKLGFVQKAKAKTNKKMGLYEITEAGIKDTDAYTAARRSVLLEMFKKEKGLKVEETTETLSKIKAIYDEAGRVAASYKSGDNK
jgi:predicted MarR family transcription regulator